MKTLLKLNLWRCRSISQLYLQCLKADSHLGKIFAKELFDRLKKRHIKLMIEYEQREFDYLENLIE